MKTIIILILLMNFPIWAQVKGTLEEQRKTLDEKKKKNDQWEALIKKTVTDQESLISKNKLTFAQLDLHEKNRQTNTEQVFKEIDSAIGGLSSAQRLISRKAAFYRCVRDSLKQKGVTEIKRCKIFHNANLKPEEVSTIASWETKLGLDSKNIQLAKKNLTVETELLAGQLSSSKNQLVQAQGMRNLYADEENIIKSNEIDEKLIQSNEKYLNCDTNTPEVSLEEKVPYPGATFSGPFVNVPRDNQDGLGTCYANAAKNLLVGVSQGNDVASYLDIALAYKGEGGVVASGLDAGGSCSALEKLKSKGFCPQKFAPMEIGESNAYSGQGLLSGKKGSVYDQAVVVRLLQKFLVGREALLKGDKDFSEQVLKQSKAIVHNIKLRPNIMIPMPGVRTPIPSSWKFSGIYAKQQRKTPLLTFDQFHDDYQKEYRKFYPAYVRGVIQGKSQEEIFEAFKSKMTGFISKYNLDGEMEEWKRVFIADTNGDFKDPEFKKKIAESVDFMKLMSGKKGKSDEEFLKFCDETQGDSLQFLNALQPLIKHLKESDISTEEMFTADGKFKKPAELMQLVVAPACLSPENRKKFSAQLSCVDGYSTVTAIKSSTASRSEKVKQLRSKVAASLLQGYPLGNTFARHINTIVGMRFNKELNRCEYKIRESQNATSTWQAEAQLYDVIEGLTEVRRK